jgi:hypothetical protein
LNPESLVCDDGVTTWEVQECRGGAELWPALKV